MQNLARLIHIPSCAQLAGLIEKYRRFARGRDSQRAQILRQPRNVAFELGGDSEEEEAVQDGSGLVQYDFLSDRGQSAQALEPGLLLAESHLTRQLLSGMLSKIAALPLPSG